VLVCIIGVICCNAAPASNSTASLASRPALAGAPKQPGIITPGSGISRTTLASKNVTAGTQNPQTAQTRVRVQRSPANVTAAAAAADGSSEEEERDSSEIESPKNPLFRPHVYQPTHPINVPSSDSGSASAESGRITPGGGAVVVGNSGGIGGSTNQTRPVGHPSPAAHKYFGIDDPANN